MDSEEEGIHQARERPLLHNLRQKIPFLLNVAFGYFLYRIWDHAIDVGSNAFIIFTSCFSTGMIFFMVCICYQQRKHLQQVHRARVSENVNFIQATSSSEIYSEFLLDDDSSHEKVGLSFAALQSIQKFPYDKGLALLVYEDDGKCCDVVRDKEILATNKFGNTLRREIDGNCSICLCDSEIGERLSILPCRHIFHSDCFETWGRNHHTCPLCTMDLNANAEGDGGGSDVT